MNRQALTVWLAAAAILAVPAAAQEVAAEDTPKKEKKICRTEKLTGSLTRRSRICLTAAQWQEVNNRTRKGLDELVGSASGAPKCISSVDAACGGAGPGGPPSPSGF